MDIPMPDFFIAGAPKCGTTALHHYLRNHPALFLPEEKEPHYYATDIPRLRNCETWQEYLSLFSNPEARGKRCGEASVWYLYSSTALQRIRRQLPHARLLIMLRNPVDFVQSVHSGFVFEGIEPIVDFMAAWEAQGERSGVFKKYRRLALFGEQMERVFALFPRSQVHVVLLEDFSADTRQAYLEVLGFLGVADDGRRQFPRVGENVTMRSRAVERFARDTPAVIAHGVALAKRLLGIERFGILDRLREFNARPVERKPLTPDQRGLIVASFRDEILKLQELIGRDLGHWLA